MIEALVDTDVLIWYFRGNAAAAELLDEIGAFAVSAVTYMELVQGVRHRGELQLLRQALAARQARTIPIDEAISHRATYLVEAFALSHGLGLADALIAATALGRGLTLRTGNDRHYRPVEGLVLETFRPA